jgi:RNA polymerase sigma-70 factor (ECF subfamily)
MSSPLDIGGSKNKQQRDAQLMRRIAQGDQGASSMVVSCHLDNNVALASRILSGDVVAAEDVSQQAFLRLWQQAPNWQPRARIGTWLYRVVYNLCIDELRRRGRLSIVDDDKPEHIDSTSHPHDLRYRRQRSDIIEAAIAALPERQRIAITLVHFQEVSNIEAADMMGISIKALESLLTRARRGLRDKLADQRSDLLGDTA